MVDDILRGCIWQGQTSAQLRDALGPPEARSERVLKTKTKETWKYYRTGKNRYSLRITLDDGVVVGWTDSS